MSALPPIVAHRGWATRYPENSLVALRAAIDAGVPRVEFDVQLSVDQVPVVIHDPTLERTARRPGSVLELTWAELAGTTLHLESGTERATLSTLAEVAAALADVASLTAFVELKRHSIERFGARCCVERCLEAVTPIADRTVFTSFEADALRAARSQGMTRLAWVLREYDAASIDTARELAPEFLFCNHEKLPADETALPGGAWRWVIYEVQSAALARSLWDRGAHLMETMAVGEMLAALDGGAESP
jgi:glycerophosphoryl diester phosphodiesterase